MTKVEIQKEALGLPEAERLHLADALVESVVPFSLDEAEAGQARSGPKGLPDNPGDVISAAEVHRKASRLRETE